MVDSCSETRRGVSGGIQHPLRLLGKVLPHHWGKIGQASRVAGLLSGAPPEGPLAEFWLGGHPRGCAEVELADGSRRLLTDLGDMRAKLLGPVRHPFGLPYILKVLSIDPSWGLSIQAHPDLARARRLHALDPVNYPDASHKPEVGIPLSPVTLLYGFRSLPKLREALGRFPELRSLLPDGARASIEEGAAEASVEARVRRDVFSSLMRAGGDAGEGAVSGIVRRFEGATELPIEVEIVRRLRLRYGDRDVGLLALFVMNIVTVPPGEVIFIGPNVPHAYLDGDLVECMACSDNVVRAGLTPKFKDVETLLEMLDYSAGEPTLISPTAGREGLMDVAVPAAEFVISYLPRGSGAVTVEGGAAAEVILCLGAQASVRPEGSREALVLRDGGAALIPPLSGRYVIERSDASVYRVAAGSAPALP